MLMTGTNNFLPHATGTGANVVDQSLWNASPSRITGFQAGVASSAEANKALRQASSMAAMLGTFIAEYNFNAIDDGDITTLEDSFKGALGALISANGAIHYGAAGGTQTFVVSSVTPEITAYLPGHV